MKESVKTMEVKACLLLVVIFCLHLSISNTAIAQEQRIYKKHDVIELTGGMKVEILQIRGEGPLEECDVIYYKEKRQTGTRMWQNTNRLRDEERAANLEKEIASQKSDLSSPVAKKLLPGLKNTNKTIDSLPATVAALIENSKRSEIIKTPVTVKEPLKTADTGYNINLRNQVHVADSIVKAKAKNLAKDLSSADSSDYDKMFIPKVSSEGETRLINSVIADSINMIKTKNRYDSATKSSDSIKVSQKQEKTTFKSGVNNRNVQWRNADEIVSYSERYFTRNKKRANGINSVVTDIG